MDELTPELLEEIKTLLRASEIRHGQAFRALELDTPVQETAAGWGTSVRHVRNVMRSVGYMLAGEVPTTPTMARINSFGYRELWEQGASPRLLSYLKGRLYELQQLNPEVLIEPMGTVVFPTKSSPGNREAKSAGVEDRVFGHVDGQPVGTTYADRKAVASAKVHRQLRAGICGGAEGAESIVVSGGYVDDQDFGDTIVYTGHGGRDQESGRQIADQELVQGNLALYRSWLDGLPVRVVRGHEGDRLHSPPSGYRYDGLFRVDEAWRETGQDGFLIWRFRLVALDDRDLEPDVVAPERHEPATRMSTTIQRIVRNTKIGEAVKRLHNYTCQVCGLQLSTLGGPYAEAAHIQALGTPHNGPDVWDNLLCLCPNDHVRFDAGAIYIDPQLRVRNTVDRSLLSALRLQTGHIPNDVYIAYHRERFAGVDS